MRSSLYVNPIIVKISRLCYKLPERLSIVTNETLQALLNQDQKAALKNIACRSKVSGRREPLITRRTQVQVLPPLLRDNRRLPGYPKQAGPAVFDSESLPKKEIFYEPATYRLECRQSDHRIPAV
jgi:hypothetical protein